MVFFLVAKRRIKQHVRKDKFIYNRKKKVMQHEISDEIRETTLAKIDIMLRHRGLTIDTSSQGVQTLDKTSTKVYNIHRLETSSTTSTTSTLRAPCALLFYTTTIHSLGKSNIKEVLKFSSTVDHIIVFGHVSLQAKSQLESSTRYCEVIDDSDIIFDKCSSVLVPTYQVVKKEQVDYMLKHYYMSLDQLPKMKRNDAMVRYLGFRPGSVVLAVETNTYRLVE